MPIVGAVLEIGSGSLAYGDYGTGIVRITPFAGVWIDGIGFARFGVSTDSQKEQNDLGESKELKRLDFSTQIGISALGPAFPYIGVSYVRAGSYSQSNDAKWNEWGLGFGHRFVLSPLASIVVEAEHRWVAKHYDRLREAYVSGRRLQMNFGLVANLF